MCVLIFLPLLSETYLILRRYEQDTINNVYQSLYKVLVILVRFLWNLNFLDNSLKNIQLSNFMKIHPVGRVVPCGQTDGRTDMMKLIVAFFAVLPTRLIRALHCWLGTPTDKSK
jgi:hypothetical protein